MSDTKITVRQNGPYLVEGEFTVVDAEGNAFGLGGRTRISLCSCGHSENKPFCDGAHKPAGFECDRLARDLPPPGAPSS
jgi:CDGSH-type Zn-finger protein